MIRLWLHRLHQLYNKSINGARLVIAHATAVIKEQLQGLVAEVKHLTTTLVETLKRDKKKLLLDLVEYVRLRFGNDWAAFKQSPIVFTVEKLMDVIFGYPRGPIFLSVTDSLSENFYALCELLTWVWSKITEGTTRFIQWLESKNNQPQPPRYTILYRACLRVFRAVEQNITAVKLFIKPIITEIKLFISTQWLELVKNPQAWLFGLVEIFSVKVKAQLKRLWTFVVWAWRGFNYNNRQLFREWVQTTRSNLLECWTEFKANPILFFPTKLMDIIFGYPRGPIFLSVVDSLVQHSITIWDFIQYATKRTKLLVIDFGIWAAKKYRQFLSSWVYEKICLWVQTLINYLNHILYKIKDLALLWGSKILNASVWKMWLFLTSELRALRVWKESWRVLLLEELPTLDKTNAEEIKNRVMVKAREDARGLLRRLTPNKLNQIQNRLGFQKRTIRWCSDPAVNLSATRVSKTTALALFVTIYFIIKLFYKVYKAIRLVMWWIMYNLPPLLNTYRDIIARHISTVATYTLYLRQKASKINSTLQKLKPDFSPLWTNLAKGRYHFKRGLRKTWSIITKISITLLVFLADPIVLAIEIWEWLDVRISALKIVVLDRFIRKPRTQAVIGWIVRTTNYTKSIIKQQIEKLIQFLRSAAYRSFKHLRNSISTTLRSWGRIQTLTILLSAAILASGYTYIGTNWHISIFYYTTVTVLVLLLVLQQHQTSLFGKAKFLGLQLIVLGAVFIKTKNEQYLPVYLLVEFGTLVFLFSLYKSVTHATKQTKVPWKLLIPTILLVLVFVISEKNTYWVNMAQTYLTTSVANSDFESLKMLLTLNSLQVVVPMFAFILSVTILIMSINLLAKQIFITKKKKLPIRQTTLNLFEEATSKKAEPTVWKFKK